MLTLLWVKGNSSFLTTELGHQYFPAFRLELKHLLILDFESSSLQIGIYTISSPVYSAC